MNTLYTEFEVERLKRYLDKNPQEAYQLAITHFEDYLEVTTEYKKLRTRLPRSPRQRELSVEKQLQTLKLPLIPNQTTIQTE